MAKRASHTNGKKRNGKTTNGKAMNAIDLLKADHRAVEKLFAAFEETSAKATKAKLAEQICFELSVHATIEEELFYPSLRGAMDEEDMLDEAQVEHDGAKVLIAEIMAGEPGEEFFDAKVKVLSEEIKHHVKEEEGPGGIFSQAKKSGVDLADLGRRLAERKEELKAEFKSSGIPTPETRSMKGAEVRVGQPIDAPL
jgi:hemerythrin superfamily protein